MSNICENLFFENLCIFKTFKKSWLENYLVKARLKSLKSQNFGFPWFKQGLFFCEGRPELKLNGIKAVLI